MQGPLRILIVDDDANLIEIIQHFLSAAEYRVKCCTTPSQGLALAREYQPHLIILDVRMPTFDGWELCEMLKSSPTTEAIPVLFLTGLQQDLVAEQTKWAGGTDYLSKPFNRDGLLEKVEMILRQAA
jgi:DNA-binding response OmpR family regulator